MWLDAANQTQSTSLRTLTMLRPLTESISTAVFENTSDQYKQRYLKRNRVQGVRAAQSQLYETFSSFKAANNHKYSMHRKH